MRRAIERACEDVQAEAEQATADHGEFRSAHEAYGVLAEEVDEFWAEVKKKRADRSPAAMRAELIQVAAVAVKAVASLAPTVPRAGMVDPRLPERSVELTAGELDGLPEYSLSVPTGVVIGKRWKRNLDVRQHGAAPVWVVGEYFATEDLKQVEIRWARVEFKGAAR